MTTKRGTPTSKTRSNDVVGPPPPQKKKKKKNEKKDSTATGGRSATGGHRVGVVGDVDGAQMTAPATATSMANDRDEHLPIEIAPSDLSSSTSSSSFLLFCRPILFCFDYFFFISLVSCFGCSCFFFFLRGLLGRGREAKKKSKSKQRQPLPRFLAWVCSFLSLSLSRRSTESLVTDVVGHPSVVFLSLNRLARTRIPHFALDFTRYTEENLSFIFK